MVKMALKSEPSKTVNSIGFSVKDILDLPAKKSAEEGKRNNVDNEKTIDFTTAAAQLASASFFNQSIAPSFYGSFPALDLEALRLKMGTRSSTADLLHLNNALFKSGLLDTTSIAAVAAAQAARMTNNQLNIQLNQINQLNQFNLPATALNNQSLNKVAANQVNSSDSNQDSNSINVDNSENENQSPIDSNYQ